MTRCVIGWRNRILHWIQQQRRTDRLSELTKTSHISPSREKCCMPFANSLGENGNEKTRVPLFRFFAQMWTSLFPLSPKYMCFVVVMYSSTFTISFRHDDVIKWKHFPRYWLNVSGIHRLTVVRLTKSSGSELWCFLWSVSVQTNEKTIETRKV